MIRIGYCKARATIVLVNRKSLVSACLGARHLASRLFIFSHIFPSSPIFGFSRRVPAGRAAAVHRPVHGPVRSGRVCALTVRNPRPRSVHNQIDMDTRSPLIQSLSP